MARQNKPQNVSQGGGKDSRGEDVKEMVIGGILGALIFEPIKDFIVGLFAHGKDKIKERVEQRAASDRPRLLNDIRLLRTSKDVERRKAGDTLWAWYQTMKLDDGSEDQWQRLLSTICPPQEIVTEKNDVKVTTIEDTKREERLEILTWIGLLESDKERNQVLELLKHDWFVQFINELSRNITLTLKRIWTTVKPLLKGANAKLGELADGIHGIRESLKAKKGADIEQGLRSIAQKLRDLDTSLKASGIDKKELV